MRNIFVFTFLCFLFSGLNAQPEYNPDAPPNTYRSNNNPHYWKNDPPREDYWQQDVYYEMQVELNDKKNVLHADHYKLTYWNNSPDTLQNLFFHLYQNAFQPGSYYHNLWKNNGKKVDFGPYEQQGLGTEVRDLRVNGDTVSVSIDNTIMKVDLDNPLPPGDSLVVTMEFDTYFDGEGDMRRRMTMFESYGYKHFNAVHWYPSICVYDQKFGWTTDQHLDKEFYSDFGTFNIKLELPREYIVGATGVLQNKDEVLPDSLWKAVQLENFKDKPYKSEPSVLVEPEEGATKTWHFYTENVHNFAFTADPLYRIEEIDMGDYRVQAFVREPKASRWQQTAEFTANVMRVYEEQIGDYHWPKVIVSDAKDGMEYPMLTLDGGSFPGHAGLLAHELGHMWFYGMVGTNETYRAFMDEGFTQYLTARSLSAMQDSDRSPTGANDWITKHLDQHSPRYSKLYYPYLKYVHKDHDAFLNTHSSDFNGALRHGGGYGHVYFKAGTMLCNLRYVLGDSLFNGAMQHYFDQWKMAHPYPEDFRQSVMNYVQTDLNWFFDQWLETKKKIDYAIKGIEKGNQKDEYKIHFERKGAMQMPVAFTVTTQSGEKHKYYIPNTWFEKPTDAKVLPKWYGWGHRLKPEYTAEVTIPGEIKSVEIDPEHLMADVDLRDNKVGAGGNSKWYFDHKVPNRDSWTEQRNYFRPALWYNAYDGVKAGVHIHGDYFGEDDKYRLTTWYNTGWGHGALEENAEGQHMPFGIKGSYQNDLGHILRHSKLNTEASFNAGILQGKLGLYKKFDHQGLRNPEHESIYINTKYLANSGIRAHNQYRLYPEQWTSGNTENGMWTPAGHNVSVNMGYINHYNFHKGRGELRLNMRVPGVMSDFNYGYFNMESIHRYHIDDLLLKTRFFGQWGYGNFPEESRLYLSGANPEHLVENEYTRARGIIPGEWGGYGGVPNHFQQGGGLNLRGYAGYVAPHRIKNAQNQVVNGYSGKSGASYSIELEFDEYIDFKPGDFRKNFSMDAYLFTDGGFLDVSGVHDGSVEQQFRMDAGLGTMLSIKPRNLDMGPVNIRFDMPFFLNTPPAGKDYIDFRYVVGVNRTFRF